MQPATIRDIISSDSSHKVCVLRVNNIPDSAKSWEIYSFLEENEKLLILDVKIETPNAKNDQEVDNPVSEKFLSSVITQGPSVIFRQELDQNQLNGIQDVLDSLELNGSCVRVEQKSTELALSTYFWEDKANGDSEQYLGKCRDLDGFLTKVRNIYQAGRINYGYGDLPNFSLADNKNFDLPDQHGVGRGRTPAMPRDEKKYAKVTVLGDPSFLDKTYSNYKMYYQNAYDIYIHYKWAKKDMDYSQITKYLRLVHTKRVISCQNIELGVFNPTKTDEFSCYWDLSRIRKQSTRVNFSYSKLTGKPSKKVDITFEIPSLNKFIKIEFSFKLSERVCREVNKTKDTVSIYFELAFSPRYSVLDYNDNRFMNYMFSDQWERVPHFALNPDGDELLNVCLTQSTVIKLTFDRNNHELDAFLKLVKSVGLEIEEIRNPFQRVEIEEQAPYLTTKALNRSNLNDEAKYALLACLTQQKVSLFQITRDFFKTIQDKDEAVVEKTLKDIASKNRKVSSLEKEELTQKFESYFWTLYEENMISKPQWKIIKVPDHMCKTKRVTITPTRIIFYVEEAELSNTILSKYKKFQNQFLRVTLSDEVGEAVKNMKYISETRFKPLLRELPLLGKIYKFLAFSASQLRNNSLWMMTETEGLTVTNIHMEIGDLTKIKNSAKYGARLGQLFSASVGVLSFKSLGEQNNKIVVDTISDILVTTAGHQYNFSDGVGKISKNLIEQIKINLKIKGKVSAIQIRCGGYKGILVTNSTIDKNTIHWRPSMKKFDSHAFDTTLELLDYNKYRPGYLNRQIIILLLTNGLNPGVLLDLQDENIKDLEKLDTTDSSIFGYINNEHHMSPTKDLLRDCILAEIDIAREPFVKGVVDTIKVRSFLNLMEKTNILVKKSARLTGVLDEHGVLNYGEIFLRISPSNGENEKDEQVIEAEKVIVTKNPCLHPGDIRILKAVNTPLAQNKFKDLVNCIVFPAKGPRPHTDEISGSDLDGDMYFISWDERLIPPAVKDPMSYSGPKPPEREVKINDIITFFVNYTNNDVLGRIDNSHLAFADQDCSNMALNENCQKLAQIHATAVDYAKTGICPSAKGILFAKQWPDYMEKDSEVTYESENILGNLYRLVKSEIEGTGLKNIYKNGSKELGNQIKIDEDMILDGFEDFLEEAFDALKEYYKEIQALINLYGIQTEYEIFSGNFLKFMSMGKNKKYNLEKLQEKMINHIQALIERFTELLTKGMRDEDIRDKNGDFTDLIMQKASALYAASYFNEGCQISKVNEAMNILQYHKRYQEFFDSYNVQMIGLPWYIFKDIILGIKKKNKALRAQK